MSKQPMKSDPSLPEAAPVSGKPAATLRAAASAPTPPAPKIKPRYVHIENKLRQPLSLSVINDDDKAEELKLAPLSISAPVREDRLTDQVRRFAADGKVRIR